MTSDSRALIVLDEHVTAIAPGLRYRGIGVRTVADLGVTSTSDPDVIRKIDSEISVPWVLVTQDGTIIEDFPGFEWERYAIAWIVQDKFARGAAAEASKQDVIHHHANEICTQRPGDHWTYFKGRRIKAPPSVASRERRS